MRKLISFLLLAGFSLAISTNTSAQQTLAQQVSADESDSDMLDGILAFREQRYQDAVLSFERAVDVDEQPAEAHFLLARIFWETPLKDQKRAGKELDSALELDPGNVQYLVARMQQLHSDTWNIFQKMTNERRRQSLAKDILKIDSTNAFAHQELGKQYIRDFWRYRNAVVYPHLLFAKSEARARTVIDPIAGMNARIIAEIARENLVEVGSVIEDEEWLRTTAGLIDPQSILLADKFDVETLESQGINVQHLSDRADKAYDMAIGHLHIAVESDPRQRSAYSDLMQIYALKGEYGAALDMLEQMYLFFPEDPELWTYLGYAHYESGNYLESAKVFEKGFEFMDEDMAYAYNNLKLILPEDEKSQYEKDEVAYSARFWTSKDPRYLTPYNERKLAHYARLTYADLLYGSPGMNLRGWDTERGHILVRYGVPNADVIVIPKSTSNIDRSVQPVRGDVGAGEGDTSSILGIARDGDGWDMFEEANTYNIWNYGEFKFVFEDPFRNGEYRLYSPSSRDIAEGTLPWMNDYTILANNIIRSTPERYEFEAAGRSVDVPFLVSTFKNMNSDLTDVYVNFGIPVSDFDPGEEIINVTANAGTFVIGEHRDILVEQRRTIYGLRTQQIVRFEESNLWIDTEELRVPPGNHEISIEFETVGAGVVGVQRRAVTVRDYSGNDLQMSDLLLAYRIEETEDGRPVVSTDIVRNGVSIMPAPWSVFNHEQPIFFYFELYNLAVDGTGTANYEVEAVLAPKEVGSGVSKFVKGIFGSSDEGVSVRLPIQIQSTNDGQYLLLDASNQEPGLYTLRVKVKDMLSGKTIERKEDLFLE
ncbi:MAG: tetratricopeptide repeat protein [Bacteroidetes bacterium]|nr:MAG: tetratricopeptide repeat protein [Bacteroidota bacterium]